MAHAATTLMTVEEFARLPDGNVRCELVRGEVIEMTPSAAESGRIGSRIAIRLGAFVEAHELGITYIPDAGFLLARAMYLTKSIDPGMTIETVRLEEKTGGTRGDYLRGG